MHSKIITADLAHTSHPPRRAIPSSAHFLASRSHSPGVRRGIGSAALKVPERFFLPEKVKNAVSCSVYAAFLLVFQKYEIFQGFYRIGLRLWHTGWVFCGPCGADLRLESVLKAATAAWRGT